MSDKAILRITRVSVPRKRSIGHIGLIEDVTKCLRNLGAGWNPKKLRPLSVDYSPQGGWGLMKSAIAVACHDSNVRNVKALIIGPSETPYEFGFFEVGHRGVSRPFG